MGETPVTSGLPTNHPESRRCALETAGRRLNSRTIFRVLEFANHRAHSAKPY